MTSTTTSDVVGRYLRFWNAGSAEEQRALADQAFTDDVTYHAVPGVFTGTDALVAFREQFLAHVGAATYAALGEPDGHHGRARLRWQIVLGDGTSFAEGIDVLTVGPDGRITAVTAFLDRAPEGFDQHARDEEPAT